MEMNDENIKLAKIKKSCHLGKIAARIFCIIGIVGCVCGLIVGIGMFVKAETLEPQMQRLVDDGKITPSRDFIGSVQMFNIDGIDPEDWESDIPAVQEALDNHPYTIIYGTYALMAGGVLAVLAVLMSIISGTFGLIEKEDTPFTDKVIKRVTIVMGVISGLMLVSASAAFGIVGALVTWVVYNIMDYGKTLQIQSDETL